MSISWGSNTIGEKPQRESKSLRNCEIQDDECVSCLDLTSFQLHNLQEIDLPPTLVELGLTTNHLSILDSQIVILSCLRSSHSLWRCWHQAHLVLGFNLWPQGIQFIVFFFLLFLFFFFLSISFFANHHQSPLSNLFYWFDVEILYKHLHPLLESLSSLASRSSRRGRISSEMLALNYLAPRFDLQPPGIQFLHHLLFLIILIFVNFLICIFWYSQSKP